ncbi:hypothetical protein IMSHALPRED_002985 [Imshaugia aleurites]|uniref:Uncharacterized protein n=1 Tax=Imshaugia aleurites TaxID=172621 RepID=A0A8H3F111_9LECA|nr:hypothetical protein IMSHALPRED_002985 [Imshaugia aleurites]
MSTPPTKTHPPSPSPLTRTPIPLLSPLRTHPKRGLPPTLASTYPHGHISGHPRSASQQASLDARKAEILRTMGSSKEIERAYEVVVGRIREELEECERRGREVEGEMEKLRMEREMERRVWGKLRGLKEGGV